MNTKTLAVLALAAFALVAVPSATADSAEAPETEIGPRPFVIPCVLHVQEVDIGGQVTIREVEVGDC